MLEGVDVGAGGALAQLPGDVLIGNGQKTASATAGVVYGLPELRIDRMHHGTDHLAWREELAAVGIFLPHLQQQIFIYLRQSEEVLIVHMVDIDLVNLVEDIAQIGFTIHAHLFHRRHGTTHDALLATGCRVGQACTYINVQTV
ncbi:hypothetical protein D3C81_1186990 [compost metagenome]